MFLHPFSDPQEITTRSRLIRHFADTGAGFPYLPEWFDAAEAYLANSDERTMLSTEERTLGRKIAGLLAEDPLYKTIHNGIVSLIGLVNGLYALVSNGSAGAYEQEAEKIRLLFNDGELAFLLLEREPAKLSYSRLAELDRLLRFRHRLAIRKILNHLYQLDVYVAVARLARERDLSFPEVLPAGAHTVRLEAVYHPLLKSPVPNTLTLSPDANMVFLTGANMAGKSTLMKTLGIAVYLAHLGFPVPARSMAFSVFDGLYTTINLSDNLTAGASHFYAEVLRIKKIAKEISLGRNLFVIFDELFRGTNVKDAGDATIAIAGAFARKRNCLFIVSTHIIEAGEVLKQQHAHIKFVYLPTLMDGNRPVYTYILREGITTDRHGMVIINNEGILDILKGKKNSEP
jgi:hypothetical protein